MKLKAVSVTISAKPSPKASQGSESADVRKGVFGRLRPRTGRTDYQDGLGAGERSEHQHGANFV